VRGHRAARSAMYMSTPAVVSLADGVFKHIDVRRASISSAVLPRNALFSTGSFSSLFDAKSRPYRNPESHVLATRRCSGEERTSAHVIVPAPTRIFWALAGFTSKHSARRVATRREELLVMCWSSLRECRNSRSRALRGRWHLRACLLAQQHQRA